MRFFFRNCHVDYKIYMEIKKTWNRHNSILNEKKEDIVANCFCDNGTQESLSNSVSSVCVGLQDKNVSRKGKHKNKMF